MNKFSYIFILFLFLPLLSAGTLSMHFVDLNTMSSVSDVNVDVYDYDSNVLLFTVSSEVDGTLNMDEMDGKYVLRFSKENYLNEKLEQTMVNGTDVDLGDRFMVPLSKVNVNVSNSSQSLNAVVTIQEDVNTIVDGFEGSNGELNVLAGSYTIFVYAPNHVQKSFPIDLMPGEVQNKNYVLEYSNETLFPSVVSVEVDLSETSIEAGDEVELNAKAIYNNGDEKDITSVIDWDSTAGYVYGTELITKNIGEHTISATYLGKTGSSVLTVSNGEVVSLTISASKTSIEINEKSTLTFNLEDVYSNVFTTTDVNCTTSCGTLNGNEFSSSSVGAATISCVYNPNNDINSTITINVNKDDDDSGSSGNSGSSGSTRTTTTTTTTQTTTTTIVPEVEEEEEKLTSIKFILPQGVEEGEIIEIIVTDVDGEPVEFIEITIMDPENEEITLVSNANGVISLRANAFGNYFLYSEDYTIVGPRVVYVKSLMPEVGEANTTPIVLRPDPIIPVRNETENELAEEDPSVYGILAATISGEMNLIDALKATVHLWILVAITLISAAVFFVVYTYVIGKSISDDSNVKSDDVEKTRFSVSESESAPVTPPVMDEKSITEAESELEEKLRKLRELKRNL
jgi:hypothetical protein